MGIALREMREPAGSFARTREPRVDHRRRNQIAGATSAEQVRANVRAGSWVPTAEDRAALEEIA